MHLQIRLSMIDTIGQRLQIVLLYIYMSYSAFTMMTLLNKTDNIYANLLFTNFMTVNVDRIKAKFE